jgi:hypothetical protein
MGPGKISSLHPNLRRSKLARRRKKPRVPRNKFYRIAHEIANQLTIINLSCFKLRGVLANEVAAVSENLEKVERAVLEISTLAQVLSSPEDEPALPRNDLSADSPRANNVYRLFDPEPKT